MLNLNLVLSIWFTLLCHVCVRIHADLFTAIVELENLLETHKRVKDDLDFYIEKEEQRLSILKRHLNIYKREHSKAMYDTPNYLGNPINAFTLIKRLTADLQDIENNIKNGTENAKNVTIMHVDVKYPTLDDLTGAAQALTRLQKTYHLDVKELAEGKLRGVFYGTAMTASDCYELGRALYKNTDFVSARSWMFEALRRHDEEKISYSFTAIDILEHIRLAYYFSGDIRNALLWTQKLLEIDPNHSRAQLEVMTYQNSIAKEEERLRNDKEETVTKKPELTGYAKERETYEALCRGDLELPVKLSSRLTCRYMSENHPFLKIGPLKIEIKYINPDVVLFYDVISEGEIETIKEMARPRFKRALVKDSMSGNDVTATYRISKVAWLKDKESDVVTRLSRRVSYMTGLSMETAEQLQVLNYGIGGHYEPHYDFTKKEMFNVTERPFGNRIATVLFYMSDVAQGGATVFTNLGISVNPVKGTAVFWLNLHASGEGDFASRHAACPVLQGSKWVCNKWLHQGGQELLKPCNLEYQQEGIVHEILQPVPKISR